MLTIIFLYVTVILLSSSMVQPLGLMTTRLHQLLSQHSSLISPWLVRKGGHFFVYGTLSLLLLTLFKTERYPYLKVIAVTLTVALLDEFIQSLTIGRSGRWQDVLIDLAGVLVFTALYATRKLSHKLY